MLFSFVYSEEMTSRGYANFTDLFCYICRTYRVKKPQRKIADIVKKVYFVIKLGDQDKHQAPHKEWSVCVEELRQWFQGKYKLFRWLDRNKKTQSEKDLFQLFALFLMDLIHQFLPLEVRWKHFTQLGFIASEDCYDLGRNEPTQWIKLFSKKCR